MNVLVFAPHADDEVLGCGGTIAKYVKAGHNVYVCVVTSGNKDIWDQSEMVKNNWPSPLYPEASEAHKILGVKETFYLGFPCVTLENVPRHILNGAVDTVIQQVKPDVVYIPHYGDMQKDHAVTAEAVMVAVRPKTDHVVRAVYGYETLSETEWNTPCVKNVFIPNVYENIDGYVDLKVQAMECYKSQIADFPNPRSSQAIRALAQLRGLTMCVPAAEAFMLVREYRAK